MSYKRASITSVVQYYCRTRSGRVSEFEICMSEHGVNSLLSGSRFTCSWVNSPTWIITRAYRGYSHLKSCHSITHNYNTNIHFLNTLAAAVMLDQSPNVDPTDVTGSDNIPSSGKLSKHESFCHYCWFFISWPFSLEITSVLLIGLIVAVLTVTTITLFVSVSLAIAACKHSKRMASEMWVNYNSLHAMKWTFAEWCAMHH